MGAVTAAVLNGLFRHGPWNREKTPAGADADERPDEVSRGH